MEKQLNIDNGISIKKNLMTIILGATCCALLILAYATLNLYADVNFESGKIYVIEEIKDDIVRHPTLGKNI